MTKRGRPAVLDRPTTVSVRLSHCEYQALQDLATLYGTSLGGAVNRVVREQWAATPLEQQKAAATIRSLREPRYTVTPAGKAALRGEG